MKFRAESPRPATTTWARPSPKNVPLQPPQPCRIKFKPDKEKEQRDADFCYPKLGSAIADERQAERTNCHPGHKVTKHCTKAQSPKGDDGTTAPLQAGKRLLEELKPFPRFSLPLPSQPSSPASNASIVSCGMTSWMFACSGKDFKAWPVTRPSEAPLRYARTMHPGQCPAQRLIARLHVLPSRPLMPGRGHTPGVLRQVRQCCLAHPRSRLPSPGCRRWETAFQRTPAGSQADEDRPLTSPASRRPTYKAGWSLRLRGFVPARRCSTKSTSARDVALSSG